MLSRKQVLQQGRYHIISQFEHKEIGISYKAFDNVLKKDVIINETSSDINLSSQVKAPFAKHLENLTSIKHESFTEVHGFFSELDQQYLVTEAVDGESLKDFLEKESSFDFSRVLSWIEQIVGALNYLYAKNPSFFHCDITPASLILTKDNKIKLLTNSLFNPQQSKTREKEFSEWKLPYLPLETIWTTLDYASQKVILNSYDERSAEILASPADERTDIYSLGATIYHLVTEKSPTSALERSIEVLEGKEDPLIDPNILNPKIPQNISAFLLKALEIKREDRFESVSSMFKTWQLISSNIRKVSEPNIREEALNRVELARQILRKQKEENELNEVQNKQELKESDLPKKEKSEESKHPQPNEISVKTKIRKSNESVLVVGAEENQKNVSVAEPEKTVVVSADPIIVSSKNEDEIFTFSDEPARKSSMGLILAIAAAVVLSVGGFFGYSFLNKDPQTPTQQSAVDQTSGESKKTAESITDQPNQSVTQNETKTENSVVSKPEPSLSESENKLATLENQKADESTEVQKTNETVAKNKKNNTVISAPEKKEQIAAKTPAPEKKKVTVDDIINDN